MQEIFCKNLDEFIEQAYEYSEEINEKAISATNNVIEITFENTIIYPIIVGNKIFKIKLGFPYRESYELFLQLYSLGISIEDYINKRMRERVNKLIIFL